MKHATDGQNLPIRCSIYMLQKHILTYLLTYSMKKSPSWEANWFSASQEISHILWKPKFYYRIHKCPPSVPILSHIDPIHVLTFPFLKIHINIILLCMPGSFKWSLYLRFPHQNPVYTSTLPHTCCMTHQPHSSLFDHSNKIGWGVELNKLLIL